LACPTAWILFQPSMLALFGISSQTSNGFQNFSVILFCVDHRILPNNSPIFPNDKGPATAVTPRFNVCSTPSTILVIVSPSRTGTQNA